MPRMCASVSRVKRLGRLPVGQQDVGFWAFSFLSAVHAQATPTQTSGFFLCCLLPIPQSNKPTSRRLPTLQSVLQLNSFTKLASEDRVQIFLENRIVSESHSCVHIYSTGIWMGYHSLTSQKDEIRTASESSSVMDTEAW